MNNSIPKAYKFIGKMLNVAYLTGFVREVDKEARTFKLQQNTNAEHCLTIQVSKEGRLPATREPVTVTAHIFGRITEHPEQPVVAAGTDESGEGDTASPKAKPERRMMRVADIRAIDISQPNKQSMPTHVAWLGLGAGKGKTTILPKGARRDETFAPFDQDGELKKEVSSQVADPATSKDESVQQMQSVMMDIFEATGSLNSKLGQNSNVVFVAGMVQQVVIVPKDKYRKKEYISMLIRQHTNPDQCIPVRYEPDGGLSMSHYIKEAKLGYPVKVVGQMRVKVIQNEAGDVIGHSCYVRCQHLLTPTVLKDIMGLPDWWKAFAAEIKASVDNRQRRLNALEGPAVAKSVEAPLPLVAKNSAHESLPEVSADDFE